MPLLPLLAILGGLAVLVWSADRFVAGASGLARHFGMAPLLIGMLIVGFGTSAPEMLVSALAAWQGAPGLALGNAYGSNIANIALILGLTALLSPIAVHSSVLRRELPILLGVTVLSILLLLDLRLGRIDALVLIGSFAALVVWSIVEARGNASDPLARQPGGEGMKVRAAALWTLAALLLLIASSRLLVWGAVETARSFGVSDLVIGLTIVAVGTSLPELASSIAAMRRGEHDIALGNIIGSNLFNTLAVVGIAAGIAPLDVPPEVLTRDVPVMTGLTLALVLVCAGFRAPGRVSRWEGAALLAAFLGYGGWLVATSGI
ncbi:calcium/sodium antiporter [soil metagenome]